MAYDANDPKDFAIVESLVEDATKGLKAKNVELISETKKLKEQLRSGTADPKALERLEANVERLENELEAAMTNLKETSKRATKAEKSLTEESNSNRQLLIDNGLTAALSGAKVAEQYLPAVKALLAGKVELKTVDGKKVAMVGDKELGVFVTEWSQGDEGKHYVKAPANGGSGANPGSKAVPAGKSTTRALFDGMDMNAKATFVREGGTITE